MPMARPSVLDPTQPRRAEPAPVHDDPFADLLAFDEIHETHHAPNDDSAQLRDLFGPPPRPATVPVERRGPWPTHNYGPAYEAMRQRRGPPVRRRPAERHEAEVWDLDENGAPPRSTPPFALPPPPRAETPPPAWPRRNLDEARSWLDTLDDDTLPRTTEAHLVATLRGERPAPPPQILIDIGETLLARTRPRPAARAERANTWTERILRGVAIGFVVLFTLAVLQLLLV